MPDIESETIPVEAVPANSVIELTQRAFVTLVQYDVVDGRWVLKEQTFPWGEGIRLFTRVIPRLAVKDETIFDITGWQWEKCEGVEGYHPLIFSLFGHSAITHVLLPLDVKVRIVTEKAYESEAGVNTHSPDYGIVLMRYDTDDGGYVEAPMELPKPIDEWMKERSAQ